MKPLSTELGPAGGYVVQPERDGGTAPVGPRIVCLYADPATQADLTAWADAMGFDVGGPNPHEGMAFHITLLATANDVAIPLSDHLVEPVVVVPIGVAHLGADGDTPAMVLAQDQGHYRVEEMRRYFIDTYGAEPTFAEFKPHVSLSYNWDGEPDMRDRDLPDFDMVFDRLVVREFDGAKTVAPPSAKRLTDNQKWLILLITLGGLYLAGRALFGLTSSLVTRIVDFFRGEEAVLTDQIAERERALAAAEGSTEQVETELEQLRERLAEVQGAIDEVEAEPLEEGPMQRDGMTEHRKGLLDWFTGGDRLQQAIERTAGEVVSAAQAIQDAVDSGTDTARSQLSGLRQQVTSAIDRLDELLQGEVYLSRVDGKAVRVDRKGIIDRIRGMLGDDAAADRDLLDREIREMEAERLNLWVAAGNLLKSGDDAYSPAWYEAADVLQGGAADLQAQIDATREELVDLSSKSQALVLARTLADLEGAA